MSNQEKRVITLLVTGVLLVAGYLVYLFQTFQSGTVDMANDLLFWATAMLVFIGISVGVTILVLILFHIVIAVINAAKNEVEEDASMEDEMDKLINLKSARVSSVFFGVGFIVSLVSLVLKFPPAVMLNIMFVACFLGSFFEGITQLFYYRRGVKNG